MLHLQTETNQIKITLLPHDNNPETLLRYISPAVVWPMVLTSKGQ